VGTEYEDEATDGYGVTPTESHPLFRAHLFQGWTPDAITPIVQKAKDNGLIDELMPVNGLEGMDMARKLATHEGIFSGISGGGVVLGAIQKAQSAPPGTNILAIVPDTGERYLSTPLFDPVQADMNAEEKALIAEAGATAALPQPLPGTSDAARDIVETAIASNKITIFAFNDCEFCWTLKKLFKAIGVETHTVAFDSAKYAKDDLGNEIRAACQEKTGVPTFPQVHIGGKFFGGAFDAVKAWKANELQPLIEAAGAKPETCTIDGCLAPWNGYKGDCFDFLPKWMTVNPNRAK